jgi:DNA repair protein RecO (recombination protein O)
MERGPPKPTVERDGIVVGRHDFGESDRIVRLLTPGEGRVGVLARGARAGRSRWAVLDLGCHARVRTRPGRGDLEPLVDVELLDARVHLRSSLGRLSLAAYACELCGALARDGHPEPRLFGLLEMALLLLDAAEADPGPAFRAALEAKALTFAGVAPVLDRCAVCNEPVANEMVFAPSAGGLVHRGCAPAEAGLRPVTAAHAAALEHARRAPLRDVLDGALPPGPTALLHDAIAHHLGRPLASRAVLDALLA